MLAYIKKIDEDIDLQLGNFSKDRLQALVSKMVDLQLGNQFLARITKTQVSNKNLPNLSFA